MPPPQVCLEDCVVNTCLLGESYETEPDEARSRDEIRCDKENADAARMCQKLKRECAQALKPK